MQTALRSRVLAGPRSAGACRSSRRPSALHRGSAVHHQGSVGCAAPIQAPDGRRWPAAAAAGRRQSRRRQSCRSIAAADAGGNGPEEAGGGAREPPYLRALLLSYFASQNRSLFAAKCFVEVVLDMHRRGVSVDDMAVELSLAGLQQGGRLLEPADQDALLSWVAVVCLALDMVGVALLPEGEVRRRQRAQEGGGAEDTSSMSVGLKGFVRVAVDQFLAGTDLYRLQLQQSMAGDVAGEGAAAGVSPAVRLLQQNTRLVVIALEVVRDAGLPTRVPLDEPRPAAAAAEAAGSGGAEQQQAQQQQQQQAQEEAAAGEAAEPARRPIEVPGFVLACDPDALAKCSSEERQRAAAVRLLISFMGAAMGWLYSAWDFVGTCIECYSAGYAADDVYSRLNDEEFAQSGGIGISVARPGGGANVSSLVLARWLSLTYMTLAQLGVVFPGALGQDGFAWVTGAASLHEGAESTTLEAYGLADFVLHTIRNEEERERAAAAIMGATAAPGSAPASSSSAGSGSAGEAAAEPAAEGILSRPPPLDRRPQDGFVTVEDPRLGATSPTALLMSQQISLVQMARQLVRQERARAAAAAAAPA